MKSQNSTSSVPDPVSAPRIVSMRSIARPMLHRSLHGPTVLHWAMRLAHVSLAKSPSDPSGNANTSNVDSPPTAAITVTDGTMGSGTLVASHDIHWSRAHLFAICSSESKSNIIVAFPNGRRFAANPVDMDHAKDLAAPRNSPTRPRRRSPSAKMNQWRSYCLRIRPKRHLSQRAAAASPATPPPPAPPTITTIAGAVRPGDSGGGVLNTQRPGRRRRLGPTRRPNLRHLRPTRPRISRTRPPTNLSATSCRRKQRPRRKSNANSAQSPGPSL